MRETWFEAFLMDLGFGPDERRGVLVVGLDEGIDVLPSCLTEVKEAPCRDFPCRIENQISTWLSQEARVGVKWKRTLGWRLSQRSFLGLWVLRLSRMTWMAVSGVGGDDVVHEVEELDAPAALLVAAVTLPVATSKAANSVEVPLRL